MARGAWPDGVEFWNNQRVRTPPCPSILGEVDARLLALQPFDCAQGRLVGGSWLTPKACPEPVEGSGGWGGRCLTRSQDEVIIRAIQRKTEQRRSPAMKDQLLDKIHNHTAVVAGSGLGYVGLSLGGDPSTRQVARGCVTCGRTGDNGELGETGEAV